jgi:hypothetical protein
MSTFSMDTVDPANYTKISQSAIFNQSLKCVREITLNRNFKLLKLDLNVSKDKKELVESVSGT